jgi:glycosyltransferase involved in cell wall biosynthesis
MEVGKLVLEDMLDQVVANPTAAHAWHRLADACASCSDAPGRQGVIDRLMSEVPGAGVEGFLRATFLYSLTRDGSQLSDAAQLVQAIVPFNADRMSAFLLYAYGLLLTECSDRARYLGMLRVAAFPNIVTALGTRLASRHGGALVPRPVSSPRKVALIAPEMINMDHAPTALAIHHARALAENGLSVEVFATQELQIADMRFFLGRGEESFNVLQDSNQWVKDLPPRMKFHFSSNQFSLMVRWTDMLHRIVGFDPDLVFFVGFYSPLVLPLYRMRPVLGLSTHTLPPVAPVDIWLCADETKAGLLDETWAPFFPPCQAWHHPYRISLKPAMPPISRLQIGLRQDAVALVCVGARLAQEIRPEWAALMLAFMTHNPQLQLLLVGGEGGMPPALGKADASRIRVMPYHPDLLGICRCCDVFVNPPRMGGGFSVGVAMAAGLPVAAYAGSDGGDKVGEAALADDRAFFSRLQELVDSPAERERAGDAMRLRFHRTLDMEQAGPSLVRACELAVARFNRRLGQSSS